MKQVLVKRGEVIIEDVPAPMVDDGTVLVEVAYSCISAGTEISAVSNSGESLWMRAIRQPEKVKSVWSMVHTKGISNTIDSIKSKVNSPMLIGYSCAGVVIDVGRNVPDVRFGDRVACAGGSYAYHAEVVNVPRNLITKVPDGVTLDLAATATLGAIAMQGVRRANPTLEETFVVLGLGILGQITAQLLRVNGCRVIGVDIDPERVELATSLGMDMGFYSTDEDVVSRIFQISDGFGADGVIITAATPSNAVVSTAFQMCRKKGRVVLVGDVGLNLKRADFYQKEIDFLISSSYGPGRYENNYEEKGLDYPIGYVRWTENRNMQAYLHLITDGKINLKPLVDVVYDIHDVEKAYASLQSKEKSPVMLLLSYPDDKEKTERKVVNPSYMPSAKKEKIRIAVAGAGSFAKEMHLPNLRELSRLYSIEAIQSRSGANAKATAQQCGARYATTNFQDVLDDDSIDAVLISTRHNLHAELTLKALEAGKHVLVEKPLALKNEELQRIVNFYQMEGNSKLPILLTGFNRRFSAYARKIKELIQGRSNPLIINYLMNAGYIPLDHWVHTEEGGGRNLGEACHIYDLFTFLTESKVKDIHASSIKPATSYYTDNDNFVTIIKFEDGSVATLTYTALGDRAYPKERMEVFCAGKVFLLDDYKSLTVGGDKTPRVKSKTSEKGQKEELDAFANAILEGGDWPIPLWQQIQTSEIGFCIEEIIKKG